MTQDKTMNQEQTIQNDTQTDVASTVNSLSEEALSIAGSVAADLKAAAERTYDATIAEVKSQANDAKTNAANDVKDVATALRKASEDLRGGSAQERTLGQIASTLADASDALRNKDLGEILQAASRVARDNPMLFLGGAALLGFAASRYAKASAGQAGGYKTSQTEQGSTPAKGEVFAFARNETAEVTRNEGTPI